MDMDILADLAWYLGAYSWLQIEWDINWKAAPYDRFRCQPDHQGDATPHPQLAII
jgi:hypothetical protein